MLPDLSMPHSMRHDDACATPFLRRGLYAIVDVGSLAARGLDPLEFARAVVSAHPVALQIRAKELEARELLALLRAAGPMCRAAGVPMVVNDRVDLAVLAGCCAVHVGQCDLPIERVRRVAPGLRVGISTHTMEQLHAALALRPDYVAYGPVFPTTSKEAPEACVGILGLTEASTLAREAGVPLVAIGGINLDRAAELERLATASAVIQALLLPAPSPSWQEEVAARARALHAALGGATREAAVARA